MPNDVSDDADRPLYDERFDANDPNNARFNDFEDEEIVRI